MSIRTIWETNNPYKVWPTVVFAGSEEERKAMATAYRNVLKPRFTKKDLPDPDVTCEILEPNAVAGQTVQIVVKWKVRSNCALMNSA